MVKNALRKKRKTKTRKKYAELVEGESSDPLTSLITRSFFTNRNYRVLYISVNNGQTNLTKAVIRKLSATNVSQLSDEPDLSLEQFHRLISKAKAKSSVPAVEKSEPEISCANNDSVLNDFGLSPVNDNILLKNYEEDAEWDLIQHDTENIDMLSKDDLHFRDFSPTTLDEKLESRSTFDKEDELHSDVLEEPLPKIKIGKTRTKNRLREDTSEPISPTELFPSDTRAATKRMTMKNIRMNDNLNSYIEVCVQSDLLNLGFGTISRFVRLHLLRVRHFAIDGPKAFNILSHGFASKANMEKIRILMRMMIQCDIKFSPQTFAACFECCARLPQTPDTEKMMKTLHEQFENSVSSD